jgi:hypothetical protein
MISQISPVSYNEKAIEKFHTCLTGAVHIGQA